MELKNGNEGANGTGAARLSIAEEFSRFPGGRYRTHGPRSGEEFRDEYLLPLLEQSKNVVVDLSGTAGYGASFLDESFGEAGKIFGIDFLRGQMTLLSDDDPLLIDLIWNIIRDGAADSNSD